MLELSKSDAIFVGFKVETSLRHQIENLEGSEGRYISRDNSENLRICTLDGVQYVGKLIHDGLSSDRIEDVRRNVISIMQRLFPDVRMPNTLALYPCRIDDGTIVPVEPPDMSRGEANRYGENS